MEIVRYVLSTDLEDWQDNFINWKELWDKSSREDYTIVGHQKYHPIKIIMSDVIE